MNKEFYQKEITCLTRIIFNEARNEPVLGKKLVAQVTYNRVTSGKFSDTYCGVMKAKNAYSFYKPNSKDVDKVRRYPVEYATLAKEVMDGKYVTLLHDSTLYFKRCDVYNGFFSKLKMVKKVGNHCFFREHDKMIAKN
jgi:spore germination cell wall hydrolase CwlJ-like protein